MRKSGGTNHITIVSFSGIDGAGKSTQIDIVLQRLQQMGMTTKLIRFWDDVAQLTCVRESAGHAFFKGDKGIGSPDAPICRRDKNIRTWPMTCVRMVLYFIDAISARIAIHKIFRDHADFVVFDRYCYDELANLNLRNPVLRIYVQLLMRLIPKLTRSYLLDAYPADAHARKPEYPIDFVYANRAAYLELNKQTQRLTVLAPMNKGATAEAILRFTSDDLQTLLNLRECDRNIYGSPSASAEMLDGEEIRPATSYE
ncbi:MAG TPA: hypothetical protein VHD85_13305 [Terracidiphilus sp.]|nr:hypothetical protein [Terracidiphilus sp.]